MQERTLEFWDYDEWKAIIERWPAAVRQRFANGLRMVQLGGMPSHAKPLSGFDISLCELRHRDGQRVIYTTELGRLRNCIYVLDAFNKDSRKGKTMRTSDRTRIRARVARVKAEIARLEADLKARRRDLH